MHVYVLCVFYTVRPIATDPLRKEQWHVLLFVQHFMVVKARETLQWTSLIGKLSRVWWIRCVWATTFAWKSTGTTRDATKAEEICCLTRVSEHTHTQPVCTSQHEPWKHTVGLPTDLEQVRNTKPKDERIFCYRGGVRSLLGACLKVAVDMNTVRGQTFKQQTPWP
jgi:hypothetical protein